MTFIFNASFILGLLGNLVSLLVILAALRTFLKIYKKKSSEGFLLSFTSATVSLYYGLVRTNAHMVVVINAIGCVIQLIYILIFFIYSTKKSKVFMMKMIIFNVGMLVLVMAATFFLVKGTHRVADVGWIAAATSLAVFAAAPLSVMRQVVRTKSVEYMPFTLSFFLTISAVVWFFYGLFTKDYLSDMEIIQILETCLFSLYLLRIILTVVVAWTNSCMQVPNVTGFLLGTAQMIIYFVYKGMKQNVEGNAAEDEVSDSGVDHEIGTLKVQVVVCK